MELERKIITRRQLLQSSISSLMWVCVGDKWILTSSDGGRALANPSGFRTKVCIVKSLNVWDRGRIIQDVVRKMLDEGITHLTGVNDVTRSWKKIFYSTDIIGLKVNPIARQTGSTKPEVCYALIETIHENVGISIDRFIIFDVSSNDLVMAGYPLRREKGKVQIFATEQYSGIVSKGGVKAKISNIITDKCSAMINVPLLKTHVSSGISVSLKNHYGSIPSDIVRDDSLRYHADGFKNLVYLNLMSPIRDKERLIVVDGLMAQWNMGPGGDPRFQWKLGGLIMGTDPVAVDAVCLKIINEKRAEKSLDPIALPYLELAGEEGLGTNLLKEILISEKTM